MPSRHARPDRLHLTPGSVLLRVDRSGNRRQQHVRPQRGRQFDLRRLRPPHRRRNRVEPGAHRRRSGCGRSVSHRRITTRGLGHRPLRRASRAGVFPDHHRPQHDGHGVALCPYRHILLGFGRWPDHVQQSAQRGRSHRRRPLVRPSARPCYGAVVPVPLRWHGGVSAGGHLGQRRVRMAGCLDRSGLDGVRHCIGARRPASCPTPGGCRAAPGR